jgi:sugar-phosphatase
MRYAAVLSDLDGVLVESRASVLRAWGAWSRRLGLDPALLDEVMYGRPARDIVARFAPSLDVEEATASIEAEEIAQAGDVRALPGAADLLASAARIAIVTSCTPALAAARLAAAGLRPPPVLVTADHVARGKPAPDAYALAAAELGVDPADCVVLEDAPAGVQAGLAAGATVIGLLTTHAAEELAGACAQVTSVAEALPLLGL